MPAEARPIGASLIKNSIIMMEEVHLDNEVEALHSVFHPYC
jgi:hypothetical protein